jgi:hypothetical protein
MSVMNLTSKAQIPFRSCASREVDWEREIVKEQSTDGLYCPVRVSPSARSEIHSGSGGSESSVLVGLPTVRGT